MGQTKLTYKEIELKPVSGNLGAEIHGVDLSKPLTEAALNEVRQALLDNCVIFFRDQVITPEQQIDFASRFGALQVHPFIPALEGYSVSPIQY